MTSERSSASNSVQFLEVSNESLPNENDLSNVIQLLSIKNWDWDFPSGPVVRNVPANAGDTGSILGPGGPHVLWGSYARVLQLRSPWALGPGFIRRGATTVRSPSATAKRTPTATTREKPTQQGRAGAAKNTHIQSYIKNKRSAQRICPQQR